MEGDVETNMPLNFFKVGGIKNQGGGGGARGTGDVVSERIKTNVSNGTSTLQREHLCQIILKSMHKSKRYGLHKLNKFMTILSFDLHVWP